MDNFLDTGTIQSVIEDAQSGNSDNFTQELIAQVFNSVVTEVERFERCHGIPEPFGLHLPQFVVLNAEILNTGHLTEAIILYALDFVPVQNEVAQVRRISEPFGSYSRQIIIG